MKEDDGMFDLFKKKQQTQNLNAFHPVINKKELGDIQKQLNLINFTDNNAAPESSIITVPKKIFLISEEKLFIRVVFMLSAIRTFSLRLCFFITSL